jgi:hypothetical protein
VPDLKSKRAAFDRVKLTTIEAAVEFNLLGFGFLSELGCFGSSEVLLPDFAVTLSEPFRELFLSFH